MLSKKVSSLYPLFFVCCTLSARPAPGFLKGYVRRSAQKLHDRRSTLTSPGRVVTLMHQEDWTALSSAVPSVRAGSNAAKRRTVTRPTGIAFAIDPARAAEVRAYLGTPIYAHRVLKCELNVRAQGGYTLERVDVHGTGNGCKEGPVVVLVRGAECYVGGTTNPSFSAYAYVYDLAAAVRTRAPAPSAHDSHLSALEARRRELDRASAGSAGSEL
ncbi:ChaC-like protein [Lactarius hengduanensis]|nr:ChaC-like protein [Lactarius hengduanensis]